MQYGEADNVTDMEGLAVENRAANAPPEPDAAAARREAANNAVAAMSRRVGGGGIVSGIVAGYARPGAEAPWAVFASRERARACGPGGVFAGFGGYPLHFQI